MGRRPGSRNKAFGPKDPNLDEAPGGGGSLIKNRGGRPANGTHLGIRRNVQVDLALEIRERFHPSLIAEHWAMILQGQTPMWVIDNRSPHGYRIIPDPNPLHSTPTLAQRNEAVKELSNRGHGLPVQSVQLDAQFKAQLDQGLPQHLLDRPNYKLLADIASLLKQVKEQDIIDAELVEPLQEPSQVAQATDLVLQEAGHDLGQLQEPYQVPGQALQEMGQLVGEIVQELVLNNDAINEYKEISNPINSTINENSDPEGSP